MTNQEICDMYDMHPNITLRELAGITGKSVRELKKILMPPQHTTKGKAA